MLNYLCFGLFYELWDHFDLWITSMLWIISYFFYETYAVYSVTNVLTNNELSLYLSSCLHSCILNYKQLCVIFFMHVFTVHYSSLKIILLTRDRLGRIIWLSIVVICLWFRSEMGNKTRGKNLRITLWTLCHLYRFALRLGTCISYIK